MGDAFDRLDLHARHPDGADHAAVLDAVVRWWDQGALAASDAQAERAALLPRLFLDHFAVTSLLLEPTAPSDAGLAGFVVALLSPSLPEGYIHMVGVAPHWRGRGVARHLYGWFLDRCRDDGRALVRAVTSPANRRSIAFHRAMGFVVEPGDIEVDGVPAHRDHDGPGRHRVRFTRHLL